MTRLLVSAESVRDAGAVLGDALLVDDGRIAAIGPAQRLRSEGVEEAVFPGATVVPGLRDAHLHPVGYAAALLRPTLKQAADFAELTDILADSARGMPDGAALVGLRLDDETLAEGRLPDRAVLDAVLPDRPAILLRYCGHVAVANSAALALAGLDGSSPDPDGGTMDRDRDGALTGVLREKAIDPVSGALSDIAPPVSPDDLVTAATALAGVGLTGVGGMVDVDEGCWAGAGSEVDTLAEAASRLPITVSAFVIADSVEDLEAGAAALRAAGGRVRFAGLKLFADGSLGGHTAAMHEPFADAPGERGTDRFDPVSAERLALRALDLGGRVAIHAIGDRANGRVLDLMERLVDTGADPGLLRIEHASVLAETDIARLGRLGIVASVQPAFIASETAWLEKRVGPERLRLTYPFRSLTAAGAHLAGGSDSPVEPPHPLPGIAAARDRCGVVVEEALDGAQALRMFTDGAAAAIGEEARLAAGAAATFTVVSADPVTASPGAVRAAEVLATWVDGVRVPIPTGTVTWRG